MNVSLFTSAEMLSLPTPPGPRLSPVPSNALGLAFPSFPPLTFSPATFPPGTQVFHDLFPYVLPWLSLQAVIRCPSVCKSWRKAIQDVLCYHTCWLCWFLTSSTDDQRNAWRVRHGLYPPWHSLSGVSSSESQPDESVRSFINQNWHPGTGVSPKLDVHNFASLALQHGGFLAEGVRKMQTVFDWRHSQVWQG